MFTDQDETADTRKYQKERRIFQELLELKRVQINATRAEEEYIVRKLVDNYRHQGLTVANMRFSGPHTFVAYEKYLYDQLRNVSTSSNVEEGKYVKYKTKPQDVSASDDPTKCTHRTYHCHHATHTYMGVPCVAFLKGNRPSVLPKISKGGKSTAKGSKDAKLATVDAKEPVMLEIKHAGQVQKYALPTGQLDKNKRYQLTFTIGPGGVKQPEPASSKQLVKSDGPLLKPLKNV